MNLDHPNIIKCVHWFKEYFDDISEYETVKCVRYCLVMEYEKFDQFETFYHKVMHSETNFNVIRIFE